MPGRFRDCWNHSRAGGVSQWSGFNAGELVVEEEDCVAIFHSIHRVMQAEKILLEQQLKVLLIPVPRLLSADCGMAIRFAHGQLESVQTGLQSAGMESAEIWLKRQGRYVRLQ